MGMDIERGKLMSSARQRCGWLTRSVGLVIAAILCGSPLSCLGNAHSYAAVSSVSPAGTLTTPPPSFADLAERVMPAVVNISTTQKIDSRAGGPAWPLPEPGPRSYGEEDPLEEFFRRYFGERPPPNQRRSLGSGFIISVDGYIVTNSHVIRNAERIIARLSKPRSEEYDATVIGVDELTDLALIKIAASRALPALQFGSSASLRVGEWVVAVGNPFGLEQTVTVGIVSGKGRVIGAGPYDDFIQTDASINPGNSGGPLLNMRGEVVGINTAIFSRSGGNIGIGFAIPMEQARSVIAQLKSAGKVIRGWLGVSVQPVTPDLARSFQLSDAKGALVTEVAKASPAEAAGLRRGDIITVFDGVFIKESHELPALVARAAVGKPAALIVFREGGEKVFSVILGQLPSPQAKARLPEMRVSRWGFVAMDISPEVARRYRLEWEQKGVVITAVDPGSPADLAGLRHGDVIEEVNRQPIRSLDEF
ncbi:MAG: protease Do, partial [Deltaproteobacteria bacterium]|nr:protease Do [Deltaproteobacteria bacterium]